jgi:S-adenosyl-L-methionine hydrolase (adenosine-forming)
MIVLFTDFGLDGPYVGQMKAVLHTVAPGAAVVDLLHNAPAFDPRLSAYLLAAYAAEFPEGSVFVCVVDPGVGSARRALVVEAGGRLYVGPDNGLLHAVVDRAGLGATRAWEITWRPERLSDSFHGRDLFAPAAARLATGSAPEADGIGGAPVDPASVQRAGWPSDLAAIVCVDPYGNLISGIRAGGLGPGAVVEAGGRRITYARTFCEVPVGAAFWHHNSNGLVEIAVNQAPAAEVLGIGLGAEIRLDRGDAGVA